VPLVTLLYVLAGTVTYAPFLVVIVDMFFPFVLYSVFNLGSHLCQW
jgi:hypothetical protein